MDLSITKELVDNVMNAVGSLLTNVAKEFKTFYTDVEKNVHH